MTLKPGQEKSGTPRIVSTNPVNKTGRPDHPTLIDGTPQAGKVGTVSTYIPREVSNNPVQKGGRPSGMAPEAGLAGPGMSPSSAPGTTYNTGYIRAYGHTFSEANKMGTPRLSEFKGG